MPGRNPGLMSVASLRKQQAAILRARVERIERFLREQDERLAARRL